jgi:hypothetical protein
MSLHFLLQAKARTLSVVQVLAMSDDAFTLFRRALGRRGESGLPAPMFRPQDLALCGLGIFSSRGTKWSARTAEWRTGTTFARPARFGVVLLTRAAIRPFRWRRNEATGFAAQ